VENRTNHEKGRMAKRNCTTTGIFKLFGHWPNDGSLEKAFIASVKHLSDEKQAD